MGLKDALPTSVSDALDLRAQRTLLLAALTGALTGVGVAGFEWITRSQIFERVLDQDIAVQAAVLVLGLALAAGEIDAQTAYTLGALDELFQAEQWGDDYEAVDRRTSMLADIVLAARYIDLTRGER